MLTGLAIGTALVSAPSNVAASGAPPCDGPQTDPWVSELRERFVSFDQLAEYTIAFYGEPQACEGSQTMEFEGREFGFLWLDFPEGVRLRLETMPPEASIVSLTSTSGFQDEGAARRALEAYALSLGLEVDWASSNVEEPGPGIRVETFWDPEPGLNGSVVLRFDEGTLVALGLSFAP